MKRGIEPAAALVSTFMIRFSQAALAALSSADGVPYLELISLPPLIACSKASMVNFCSSGSSTISRPWPRLTGLAPAVTSAL
jgi:hypothetical protein